jgi:hypothetical protein
MTGMDPHSPVIGHNRSRKISNIKPCPNWDTIDRSGISDQEFLDRYRMLQTIRPKMLSPHHRRLIPETAWEEIVDYTIYKAVCTWRGNGDGKCPLPHWAYRILRFTAIQYWNRNKTGILDSFELDRQFMESDHE